MLVFMSNLISETSEVEKSFYLMLHNVLTDSIKSGKFNPYYYIPSVLSPCYRSNCLHFEYSFSYYPDHAYRSVYFNYQGYKVSFHFVTNDVFKDIFGDGDKLSINLFGHGISTTTYIDSSDLPKDIANYVKEFYG